MNHILKIIIFYISLICNGALAQINADFVADDTTACNSLIVHFTNQTTGEGTLTYFWDFGNGLTSTLKDPQTAYTTSGIYSVSLIATNGEETDTIIKENYIRIYTGAESNFTTNSQRIGCPPLTIGFINGSVVGDTSIVNYVWDFGDGQFEENENPVHTYSEIGNYTVSLFVEDLNECKSNISINDYIVTLQHPSAEFTFSNPISCLDTLSVHFISTDNESENLEHFWDFGDGTFSEENNPSHLYNGFEQYSVKHKVTGNYECCDSVFKENLVKLQVFNPAAFVYEDTICKNQNITISNSSTGVSSYKWNFGDGTSSFEAIPVKSYSDTGKFIIKLIASFENVCYDTIIDSVYVDPILAQFITDKNYICELPDEVNYINQSVNAVEWLWKFGNGNQSDEENPTISYSITPEILENYNKIYSDTLIIISPFGCRDTTIVDSNIVVILPKIYFIPNDSSLYDSVISGCIPLEINFENKSVSNNPSDPFVELIWDFDDGTTSTEQKPYHVFNEEGEYNVSLSITNSSGCINSFEATILAGTPQEADFLYLGHDTICGSESIVLSDNSPNQSLINGWLWEFSDETYSTTKNPVHRFIDTGYMDVIMTIFHNGCEGSTITKDSIVFVEGPAGSMHIDFDCSDPLNYSFYSELIDADSVFLDFGDGETDTLLSGLINHIYNNSGDYLVTLNGNNYSNNCSIELTKKVFPRNLQADFIYSPLYNCVGDTVSFDASSSIDVDSYFYNDVYGKYLWDFNDSINEEFTQGFAYHIFTQPGIYNVKLLVKDINKCVKEIIKPVHIYKPSCDFIADTIFGCIPLSVDFNNITQSDTSIISWYWNFGDGNISSEESPTHIFNENGDFNISLIAIDTLGCKDTLIKNQYIFISKPQVSFSVESQVCKGDTVFFTNSSSGNGLSALWDFGDGQQSENFNTYHIYNDTGYFDITLHLTDTLGCDSILTIPNKIYVQALPLANFFSEDTVATCYPALVSFINTSQSEDILSQIWDFNDQSAPDYSNSPYHNYLKPGIYDVKLSVFTSIGCKDSLIRNNYINVGGPYAEINLVDSSCVNLPIMCTMEDTVNIFDFEWSLDDGSTFTEESIELNYDSFGTKKIFLFLRSDTLNICNKIIQDSIVIPELIANFNVSDSMGCVPLFVDFSDNSIGTNSLNWYINHQYSDSNQNIEYLFNSSGTHAVKLLINNKIGCKDSLNKTITVFPLPLINLTNDTTICYGDTIQLNASGGEKYTWHNQTGISDTLISNPYAFPLITSLFYVSVTDSNNCESKDSVRISVQQIPLAEIINNDTIKIIIGENIDLQATQTEGYEYYWYPVDYLSCINCMETNAIPQESGFYYFELTDINNCFIVKDSVYIVVEQKFSVDVPKAFHPNDDGINDTIYVKGWGIKELKEFKIYNQFGKLVFETNDLSEGWTGYLDGNKLEHGVYVYFVSVLSYDNKIRTKKGYIYLIE
ncbi:MAG: PKD domain-containing protein [Bacteroidales bacterium]|nr:PKD domain-containing protein [Bacteroidales bacterium]